MYIGKTRNPIVSLLLCFVTCGIYTIFWIYQMAADLNGITGQERVSPILFILTFFIPYLPLLFVHKFDESFVEIGQKEGIEYKSQFVLWLILFLIGIGYIVFFYMAQDFLNKVWTRRGGSPV